MVYTKKQKRSQRKRSLNIERKNKMQVAGVTEWVDFAGVPQVSDNRAKSRFERAYKKQEYGLSMKQEQKDKRKKRLKTKRRAIAKTRRLLKKGPGKKK